MKLVNLPSRNEPISESVIDLLTSMLEDAKNGKLVGVVLLTRLNGHNTFGWEYLVPQTKAGACLLALEGLKAQLIRDEFGDD